MRIGVICEGETDFIGIEEFLGAALERKKITATFIPLQPTPDKTSGEGWTNVVTWLENNPPAARVINYFAGGMFEGNSDQRVDALIIQLDSDILDEPSAQAFLNNRGFIVQPATTPNKRGAEIERLLTHFSALGALTAADQRRHVMAPIVEASETWCVAIYQHRTDDCEALTGQALRDEFRAALVGSKEDHARPPSGPSDKTAERRREFCQRHKGATQRLEQQAAHFHQLVERVAALS